MGRLLLGNTSVVQAFQIREDEEPKRVLDAHGLSKRPNNAKDVGVGTAGELRVDRSDLGNRITEVLIPDGTPLFDALRDVIATWPLHSDADGPEWVESPDGDEEEIASLIARHFTNDDHECAVGRPKGWVEDE